VRAKKEMPVTVTIESSGSIGTPVRAGFAATPRYFHVDTTGHGGVVLFQ
jgi:hypothetical protein